MFQQFLGIGPQHVFQDEHTAVVQIFLRPADWWFTKCWPIWVTKVGLPRGYPKATRRFRPNNLILDNFGVLSLLGTHVFLKYLLALLNLKLIHQKIRPVSHVLNDAEETVLSPTWKTKKRMTMKTTHERGKTLLWNTFLNSLVEGSLEVKLPTIWTDEKQSREEAERRERLEERRVEDKE